MTLSCPSCPIYPVKPPLLLFNWGGIVFIFYSTGVKFRRTNAAYLTGAPKKFFISFSNFMVKKQIRIENSVPAHALHDDRLYLSALSLYLSAYNIQHCFTRVPYSGPKKSWKKSCLRSWNSLCRYINTRPQWPLFFTSRPFFPEFWRSARIAGKFLTSLKL